jgi:hypothetical protein
MMNAIGATLGAIVVTFATLPVNFPTMIEFSWIR